jgi:hypothetical protein
MEDFQEGGRGYVGTGADDLFSLHAILAATWNRNRG